MIFTLNTQVNKKYSKYHLLTDGRRPQVDYIPKRHAAVKAVTERLVCRHLRMCPMQKKNARCVQSLWFL